MRLVNAINAKQRRNLPLERQACSHIWRLRAVPTKIVAVPKHYEFKFRETERTVRHRATLAQLEERGIDTTPAI